VKERAPLQVSGKGDAVVTPHHLATAAAVAALDAGGNAVDAAIAADAVLGVVAPETCGIGGDLFALVHLPGDRAPAALNASGRAGSGVDAGAMRNEGHAEIPWDHPATATVPGCVDGWVALIDRFGSLPLDRLLTDAVTLAEEGFDASDELARSLHGLETRLRDQPAAAGLYPGGAVPSPGDRLRRPGLATTLRDIAGEGRDGFYLGKTAAAVCAATDGLVTAEDMATSRSVWVEPISLQVFGLTGWTVPPNSQGYLVLAGLWLLERLGTSGDIDDAGFWHGQVEAYRAAAWDRDHLVSDPRTAPVDPEQLLGPARLADRLAAIAPDRVADWPSNRRVPAGTAYLCAVDRNGTGVSFIQSNFMGIGSGIGAGEAGFFLHNRGAGFDLRAGSPNELAAGMRPLHTLSPTLWTDAEGGLAMLLGTRGGHHQPQLLIQMAAHLLLGGMSPAEAQHAARWEIGPAGFGSATSLGVEPSTPADVVEGLRRRGHDVEVAGESQPGWGPVSVITVDGDGVRTAAADPRVATAKAVVS
jgi:gamma-glutamyltranspeptidase/glutathione hydrolase